tara:strand:+ start:63 stop:854 length:792 start_codon:yes stop_codon:yes gene_type:complete
MDTLLPILLHDGVRCALCAVSYVAPVAALAHHVATLGAPSLVGVACVCIAILVDLSLCMSVLLHRYFAHGAMRSGRYTQFVLAWVSCLAYQMGPLWWASKHRRHHKHCDTPADPHSWAQIGWVRAWVGWTLDPSEQSIDEAYVRSLAAYPELRVVEGLWFLPPTLVTWTLHAGANVHPAYPLGAMLSCRLITLLFNCEYHPPNDHRACKATDVVRFLSEIVGESYHDDHHRHPARARRPGMDVAFHVFVRPLVTFGIVTAGGK